MTKSKDQIIQECYKLSALSDDSSFMAAMKCNTYRRTHILDLIYRLNMINDLCGDDQEVNDE